MKHTLAAALVFLWIILCSISPQAEASPMKSLDARQQVIVPIAAFTANGDMEKLRGALNQRLDAGISVNEIKEILVQMYAYCGFPRNLDSLGVFADVVKTREEKGIRDTAGPLPSPLPAGKTSLASGTEVQTKLVGGPVKGGLMDFAPAIDEYLKAHLFGDTVERDFLSEDVQGEVILQESIRQCIFCMIHLLADIGYKLYGAYTKSIRTYRMFSVCVPAERIKGRPLLHSRLTRIPHFFMGLKAPTIPCR